MVEENEIEQSVEPVSINAKPVWGVNISNWGNTPSSVTVTCYKYVQSSNTWTDVTALCFPVNTPTVSGNIITFSPFVPQAVGDNYRIDFRFTMAGGTIDQGHAFVNCG